MILAGGLWKRAEELDGEAVEMLQEEDFHSLFVAYLRLQLLKNEGKGVPARRCLYCSIVELVGRYLSSTVQTTVQ